MSHNRRAYIAVAVAALLLGQPLTSHGQDFWMTSPDLTRTFSSSTIEGQYVDGRAFREKYDAAGRLDYWEPTISRRWSGRWSVVRHRFCTIYDASGTGGCFRVRQVSANCFEFFFDTRTIEEARSSTLRVPTWTARAWRSDSLSTCEERPLV